MKYQKNFNNLSTSIIITLALLIAIVFSIIFILDEVVNLEENLITIILVLGLFFIPIIIVFVVVILLYCYEYWYFDNDAIYSKKLFRKKVIIKMTEIEKVEIKTKKVLIWLEIENIDAYIIYSKNREIEVPIFSDDCLIELEYALSKFIK